MNAIHGSRTAPATSREKTHAPSRRGTAEAILQPGSVSEVEPFFRDTDITPISGAVTAGEIELIPAPSAPEAARRK